MLHLISNFLNENFIFTEVLRKKFPAETLSTMSTKLSHILKRSSSMKGGAAYHAKKQAS